MQYKKKHTTLLFSISNMTKFVKSKFAIFISLVTLLSVVKPTLASERYPTAQEMRVLIQKFKQNIPKLLPSSMYSDRRTPDQKQQISTFSQDWSNIDPSVAPFLGVWVAIEESKAIYPSRTKGQVCIVDSFLPERDGSGGYTFTMGTVSKGMIRTEEKSVLIKEGNFLGSAFIVKDKAALYEYAYPRPLKHPASLYSLEKEPEILRKFRQAGCIAEFTK